MRWWRVRLSRFVAVAAFVFIAVTTSAWESNHSLIAAFLLLTGLCLIAIASLGRLWCALYIAGYKTKSLVSEGPYSMSRNPLYFFSLLGAVGVGMTTESFVFPLIFAAGFAIYYPFVIKHEEDKLRGIYGVLFDDYKARVPAFFPRLSKLHEPTQYIANPSAFRRSLLEALWFVWLAGIIEFLEALRDVGYIPSLFTTY